MTEAGKTVTVTASDIPKGAWVDKYLPVGLRPYARMARFDRPIGTWLLLFPGWWSVSLATTDWSPGASGVGQTLWFFILFGIGAAVIEVARDHVVRAQLGAAEGHRQYTESPGKSEA